MHAVRVLQKCLSDVFASMHAARSRVLLGAVTALLLGRRLILMDLARAWPGAQYVRAPLKRLDRLLSNSHLANEAELLYAAMARWLIRQPRPLIIVDWSALQPDGRWHLLRAGIPVGGRTLTVLDAVYPEREQNSPRVERQFLRRLKALLPPEVKPIFVTDAGFRTTWFRSVRALGWDYVGRVRNRTLVQPAPGVGWIANRALHHQARAHPRRFPGALISAKTPWPCDLVLVKRRRAAHPQRTRHQHRKAQKANREPWLLATSLTEVSAQQVVAIYARRMQIEESFRDLKCDRFGCAFYYSLTRSAERLAILLLLHALASFVAWLSALGAESDTAQRYGGIVSPRARRHYSLLRLGWERLRQRWTPLSWRDLQQAFIHPPPWWLKEQEVPR
jgi:hypothetical protein